MAVTALGYLGFEVSDLARWRSFATDFLGFMDASPPGDELRFRMDTRAWRIAVTKGTTDDLAFAGFEAANAIDFQSIIATLKAIDVDAAIDAELATKRGVTALARCTDPNGAPIEIYYGATEATETPLVSPAGVQGFLTGDQRLGHIVFLVADAAKTIRFYTEGLGFKLSDYIDMPLGPDTSLELTFLHCNPRHHTLAIAQVPGPKRLNHFMVQVKNMEDVGFADDRAQAQGHKIANTLGCHTNDQMFSSYAITPSGFEVEFGWGARTIGPDWTVVRHKSTSTWGHKLPPNA